MAGRCEGVSRARTGELRPGPFRLVEFIAMAASKTASVDPAPRSSRAGSILQLDEN
jgi:hypothetical protein